MDGKDALFYFKVPTCLVGKTTVSVVILPLIIGVNLGELLNCSDPLFLHL